MFGSNLQDQMLKAYVEKVFDKYDTDKSGTLDPQEMTYFFNDLFKQLKIPKTVTQQQSLEAIKTIDQNFDGSVDKQQLFQAFKVMLTKSQQNITQPPPQPNYNQGMPPGGGFSGGYNTGYSGYNPYNQYPNPGGFQQPPSHYNGYPQSPFYQNQNPMYNSGNPMYGSAPPTYGPMYGNPGMYQNPSFRPGHQGYSGYNPYMANNPYGGGQF